MNENTEQKQSPNNLSTSELSDVRSILKKPHHESRWIAEILIAVSTVVIALVSIIISVNSSSDAKEHRKLSVHPHIGFYIRTSNAPVFNDKDENTVGIEIENAGLGPAIIRKFEIETKSKKFRSLQENFSWKEFFEKCGDLNAKSTECLDEEVKIPNLTFYPNDAIEAGDTVTIFRIKYPKEIEDSRSKLKRYDQIIDEINLRVEYESLYGVRCVRTITEGPDCTYNDKPWPVSN